MKKLWTFIYPHQLFIDHPALKEGVPVVLIEHPHFFKKLNFHKQKLIYHRATMKDYFERLKKSGYETSYVEFDEYPNFIKSLKKSQIFIADPIEKELQVELKKLSAHHEIKEFPSPMFLTPSDFAKEAFESKSHFSMASFYILQRKRMNILIEDGKPVGGKWSFDTENRKSIPKRQSLPQVSLKTPNAKAKEAIQYIKHHFKENPGLEDCYLPIDHENAEQWLDEFLNTRLENFGEYEDAIVPGESFLYHSILSPMLNIGLLTPLQVVERTLNLAKKNKTPLNSLEGFIRQIIGWREFMKISYDFQGDKMRKTNFFKYKNKIPSSYWNATSGIKPIDVTIQKILQTAYCHHIERLMILGNFMLLSEFHPDQVYKWFMELFIDAYDWVMVPNVYAMSQYADGGTITTKPYISSSNYVLKMSHYEKGSWCEIWDSLYWHFIGTHAKLFSKNPRMKMMISIYEKMKDTQKKTFRETALAYLAKLD